MKNNIKILSNSLKVILTIVVAGSVASCELRPELPDTGSILDKTPPSASFTYIPTATSFTTLSFTNTSSEATSYEWDFAPDGVVCEMVDGEMVCGTETTTTAENPFARFEAGEGTYSVSLTALDANGASDVAIVDVDVLDVFVPLPVTVLNGDFSDGRINWTIDNWDTWSKDAFETSSDGSPNNYDGSDSGGSSTPGAKWNATRSVGSLANGNTRVAYQPLVVSPSNEERTVTYILEFEYAIKDDIATDPPEGRIVIADIIAGHYSDGDDAYAQTDMGGGTSLLHMVVNEAKGKGNFTTVTGEFDAPESGLVAVMFSAITPVDVYVDNVKVYAK
ncbi:MAG: PKD domain-containing protein [Cyclobacteriaceae bacterium]